MHLQWGVPVGHESLYGFQFWLLKCILLEVCRSRTPQWEVDMDLRPKFWRLGQDELQRVAVGEPGPTSDPGMVNGYRKCRFEWD